jgi:hypothetical protein
MSKHRGSSARVVIDLAKARALSPVRKQTASVRALLDEIERGGPSGPGDGVSEQLVEELARLGCRCLEVASELASRLPVPSR